MSLQQAHIDYLCDQCEAPITGSRYHCAECQDFDFCGGCFRAQAPEQHKHKFLLFDDWSCSKCKADKTNGERRYQCQRCPEISCCISCMGAHRHPLQPFKGRSPRGTTVHLCDVCEKTIAHHRYHCTSCDDYDLCRPCHRRGAHPTKDNPHGFRAFDDWVCDGCRAGLGPSHLRFACGQCQKSVCLDCRSAHEHVDALRLYQGRDVEVKSTALVPLPQTGIHKVVSVSAVFAQVLLFLPGFKDVAILSSVCKAWSQQFFHPRYNVVWRTMARRKWPFMSEHATTPNWALLCAVRTKTLKYEGINSPISPIENCAAGLQLQRTTVPDVGYFWSLRCPVAVERLQATADPNIDFCTVCKEHVHVVKTEKDLKEKAQKGLCVAVDPNRSRAGPRRHFRGKVSYAYVQKLQSAQQRRAKGPALGYATDGSVVQLASEETKVSTAAHLMGMFSWKFPPPSSSSSSSPTSSSSSSPFSSMPASQGAAADWPPAGPPPRGGAKVVLRPRLADSVHSNLVKVHRNGRHTEVRLVYSKGGLKKSNGLLKKHRLK